MKFSIYSNHTRAGVERAIRRAQPRPGAGSLITTGYFGTTYTPAPTAADFPHPFQPFMSFDTVRFSTGLLNGFVPVVLTKDGTNVPMDGGADGSDVPQLTLGHEQMDPDTQQSWACLEVTANDDGSVDKDSLVQIVHRDSPRTASETTGRQPLALILWQNDLPYRCLPQCWFNLRYVRVDPPPGGGVVKHYFL